MRLKTSRAVGCNGGQVADINRRFKGATIFKSSLTGINAKARDHIFNLVDIGRWHANGAAAAIAFDDDALAFVGSTQELCGFGHFALADEFADGGMKCAAACSTSTTNSCFVRHTRKTVSHCADSHSESQHQPKT